MHKINIVILVQRHRFTNWLILIFPRLQGRAELRMSTPWQQQPSYHGGSPHPEGTNPSAPPGMPNPIYAVPPGYPPMAQGPPPPGYPYYHGTWDQLHLFPFY